MTNTERYYGIKVGSRVTSNIEKSVRGRVIRIFKKLNHPRIYIDVKLANGYEVKGSPIEHWTQE